MFIRDLTLIFNQHLLPEGEGIFWCPSWRSKLNRIFLCGLQAHTKKAGGLFCPRLVLYALTQTTISGQHKLLRHNAPPRW